MNSFRTHRWPGIVCFVAALHVSAGCDLLFAPFADPRVSDGGGGSLISATVKLTTGQLGGLTQDELQILSDEVRKAAAVINPEAANLPELTNEQADAMLEFFSANGIATFEDLTRVLDAAAQDPDSIVVPESLIQAFAGSEQAIDPNSIDEEQLESLFQELFSAAGVDPNA